MHVIKFSEYARIPSRTASEWAQINIVLPKGIPGHEKDTQKLKVGDDETPWNELPYIGGEGGSGGSADSIVFKGDWEAGPYSPNAMVTHADIQWLALVSTTDEPYVDGQGAYGDWYPLSTTALYTSQALTTVIGLIGDKLDAAAVQSLIDDSLDGFEPGSGGGSTLPSFDAATDDEDVLEWQAGSGSIVSGALIGDAPDHYPIAKFPDFRPRESRMLLKFEFAVETSGAPETTIAFIMNQRSNQVLLLAGYFDSEREVRIYTFKNVGGNLVVDLLQGAFNDVTLTPGADYWIEAISREGLVAVRLYDADPEGPGDNLAPISACSYNNLTSSSPFVLAGSVGLRWTASQKIKELRVIDAAGLAK